VTPNGLHLYAAAASGNDVSHFTIDSAGNLIFAGCIGGSSGCTPLVALDGAASVTVTPNGRNLYAAAEAANDVSHFTIDNAGNLIFAGCIGSLSGCTPVGSLQSADGLAVTPNGLHLYAAAAGAGAVSHFTIDSAGNLIFAGCIGVLSGCTPTNPSLALGDAEGLAVTPDGLNLYAAALAVSHLTIAP